MSGLPFGYATRGDSIASLEISSAISPLEKRLNTLENNQKQFFSELKEYLIALENMARYTAKNTHTSCSCARAEGHFTLSASNLFNGNPTTDVKKQEEPKQITTLEQRIYDLELESTTNITTLEKRISDLESEVAFLKGLPPSLMETLGYKKV
jgi:hypothetical protein